MAKAARLAALIEKRLGVKPSVENGRTGQFDVVADGEVVASRGGNVITRVLFKAGYPDFDEVVADLQRRAAPA